MPSAARSKTADLRLDRPIVLVGLMGAGKTTVGRRLAQRLKVSFHDADHEIETAANMRIADIFEIYGEAYFREGERKVIERLLSGPPHVLATGGGAFMDAETRALVKASATSIWLRADLDLLVKRTALRDTRPLLRQGDPREILSRLLEERGPVYAQADITIDSADGPHARTTEKVLKALRTRQQEGLMV
ncbi:shikimate kinase [Parvularcula dongshanensis]|uniref:Shikimate kinase n=1 Tax=Parvularcula dongshanensis TaxID=1173995 RepID=A0A840I4Z5_9PROT|nr:shikimate kinase [Parvularcula dongshanensis]MBB4659353.1 shikimate kinase [Parvularcula dongshanensis]